MGAGADKIKRPRAKPTTVAKAAPDSKPKRLMAAATASSKKLEAPIKAEGQATLWASPKARFR